MSAGDRLGLRFLRSEIAMVLGRRRNQLMLVVLACIPVIIGVAIKVSSGRGVPDGLLGSITQNGIFVAFTAITVVLPLFLPMAIAVVVGESVAGEASLGTLRYLLAVPVARTRLVIVKFAAVALWSLVIAATVAVAGVLTGLMLFPIGPVTLLSGNQTSMLSGLLRLVVVVAYATVMMIAIGSVGLFISTLTEVPVAAMATTLTVAIVSQVLEAVPQVHVLHPWLIAHYLLNFADVLRDPVSYSAMLHGCLVSLGYVVVFGASAWARFSTKDISS